MEIRNPRRILFLGPPNSGILPLLKLLTGSAPQPRVVPRAPLPAPTQTDPEPPHELDNDTTAATTAGLTHALSIHNAYYTATIPIWLDEPTFPADWKSDFLSPEAGEVVRAVGAWVLVFRLNGPVSPATMSGSAAKSSTGWLVEMMDAVKEVVAEAHGGVEEAWDGVLLCVGMPGYVAGAAASSSSIADAAGEESAEWEDLCWARGFEFVDGSIPMGNSRDANGESKGVKRLLEALEANDWSGEDENDEALDFLEDEGEEFGAWEGGSRGLGEEDAGFTLERMEMEREMMELKMALSTPADDGTGGDGQPDGEEKAQVEGFERMMGKMVAVRDMTAHMPESERKKFAVRAVKDAMRTI